MSPFECCHYCEAPKRHLGCSTNCSEYQEAKKKWEERRAEIKKNRDGERVVLSILFKRGRHRS